MKIKTNRLSRLTLLAILIAIELLMAFTPLGYLKLGLTSITLMSVPVAVGAIVLGPGAGGILGLVFGLTSFYQCFGMDAFGVVLLDISPAKTFVLTVVSRVLMGVSVGLLFQGLSKVKGKHFPTVAAVFSCGFVGLALAALLYHNTVSLWMYVFAAVASILIGFLYHFIASLDASAAPAVLASCSAAVLNTVFFVSALVLLFGNDSKVLAFTGQTNAWGIVVLLITLNAVIEAAVCLVLGTAVSKALLALQMKFSKPAKKVSDKGEY